MKGAVQVITLFLLAALSNACAGNVDLVFVAGEDLSKCQTWNWLPRRGSNIDVTQGDPALIGAKLSRLIERKLIDNGFRRAFTDPDFHVTYQLAQRRHLVEENEPSAIYELSSLDSSPSYSIERSDRVTHRYQEMRLGIAAIRPGGGTLWHATFTQYEREHHAVKLDDAVAMLLARLPRPAPDERSPPEFSGRPARAAVPATAESRRGQALE